MRALDGRTALVIGAAPREGLPCAAGLALLGTDVVVLVAGGRQRPGIATSPAVLDEVDTASATTPTITPTTVDVVDAGSRLRWYRHRGFATCSRTAAPTHSDER